MNPLGDAWRILAAGTDNHCEALQGLTPQSRHKLHAVIGGETVTGAENFFMSLAFQYRPSPWAGITRKPSVKIYLLHRIW
jgi:hypothetical protein